MIAVRGAVPWGARDVLGVLGITVVLVMALGIAIARSRDVGEAPARFEAIALVLPVTLLGIITTVWVGIRHGSARRLFGPAHAEAGDWLRGVGWGVVAFVVINLGANLMIRFVARTAGLELPEPQEAIRRLVADPLTVPWLLLAAVALAPLSEEIFFRGMVFQALRRRISAGWSMACSAVLFAAAHVLAEPTGPAGLILFVLILPLGLLLAWQFERRGTLVTPIVTHAAFNLVTTLVLIAGGRGVVP
jgi:uncharacterized protein